MIVTVQSVDVLWLFTTSPTCAFAPRSTSIASTKVHVVPLSERYASTCAPVRTSFTHCGSVITLAPVPPLAVIAEDGRM